MGDLAVVMRGEEASREIRTSARTRRFIIGPILVFLPASPPLYRECQGYSSLRRNFSRSPSPTLFLNYMSARDLEKFDKPLKLRCPWILEPSLAGHADAL